MDLLNTQFWQSSGAELAINKNGKSKDGRSFAKDKGFIFTRAIVVLLALAAVATYLHVLWHLCQELGSFPSDVTALLAFCVQGLGYWAGAFFLCGLGAAFGSFLILTQVDDDLMRDLGSRVVRDLFFGWLLLSGARWGVSDSAGVSAPSSAAIVAETYLGAVLLVFLQAFRRRLKFDYKLRCAGRTTTVAVEAEDDDEDDDDEEHALHGSESEEADGSESEDEDEESVESADGESRDEGGVLVTELTADYKDAYVLAALSLALPCLAFNVVVRKHAALRGEEMAGLTAVAGGGGVEVLGVPGLERSWYDHVHDGWVSSISRSPPPQDYVLPFVQAQLVPTLSFTLLFLCLYFVFLIWKLWGVAAAEKAAEVAEAFGHFEQNAEEDDGDDDEEQEEDEEEGEDAAEGGEDEEDRASEEVLAAQKRLRNAETAGFLFVAAVLLVLVLVVGGLQRSLDEIPPPVAFDVDHAEAAIVQEDLTVLRPEAGGVDVVPAATAKTRTGADGLFQEEHAFIQDVILPEVESLFSQDDEKEVVQPEAGRDALEQEQEVEMSLFTQDLEETPFPGDDAEGKGTLAPPGADGEGPLPGNTITSLFRATEAQLAAEGRVLEPAREDDADVGAVLHLEHALGMLEDKEEDRAVNPEIDAPAEVDLDRLVDEQIDEDRGSEGATGTGQQEQALETKREDTVEPPAEVESIEQHPAGGWEDELVWMDGPIGEVSQRQQAAAVRSSSPGRGVIPTTV